ncbi:hypothetical protein SYNPS1DRAFT_22845 [Syncephalis pseudoplumigaleata]|uniref:Splicing factor 3B subunit 4 n=1 Tax=Syncephalis pseudoplumigaleata TaxID=1712513 RepID=A0A4P9YYH3_9FUNG|nr:hypothetical protein SYNPS1DRAFT_22845 [Syncephalis pseudoplumigaleata]|eukprot:RKP25147.1 hypothetical protein SYNPS1DRAFT_22845 [Syncephalis pseudoplumigaleata]
MSRPQDERNQEATVYVGNLDDRCTDALLWELMLQAGPVVNVHLPKDRVTQQHQNYGFCEFMTEEDADYAIKIMNMVKLYGKPIRVNKAAADKRELEVGANLFIGNLDPDVDEKMLHDTFSAFGMIVQTPKVGRDPETGISKGYGFVSFDSFEAADAAIEAMDGQYLANNPVSVTYAFKKDGKGERHGSAAERLLAAQGKKHNAVMGSATQPNRLFASVPMPDGGGMMMQDRARGGHPGAHVPPPMMTGSSGMGVHPGGYPPAYGAPMTSGYNMGYPPPPPPPPQQQQQQQQQQPASYAPPLPPSQQH